MIAIKKTLTISGKDCAAMLEGNIAMSAFICSHFSLQ